MSNALTTIINAWRVEPPHKHGSGCIISLRCARADFEGLQELLVALKQLEPTEKLDRELVGELWSIPYYVHAFIGAGQFRGEERSKLFNINQDIVVELHRILGTPQNTRRAIADAQKD